MLPLLDDHPYSTDVRNTSKFGLEVAVAVRRTPKQREVGAGLGEGVGCLHGHPRKRVVREIELLHDREVARAFEVPFRSDYCAGAGWHFDDPNELDGLAGCD